MKPVSILKTENVASNENDAPGDGRRQCKCKRRNMAVGVLLVLVVAAIVGFFAAQRPPTVKVIETNAEESLPSLIKVAPIGTTGGAGTGAILIEYTELLEDDSTVFYYLALQDFDSAALEGVTNPNNVALYLTRSADPTMEDVSSIIAAATTLKENMQVRLRRRNRNLSITDIEMALRIGRIESVDFPFRLPESFLPGDFNGALLIEEGVGGVEVSRASFTAIVDPLRNIGSSTTNRPSTDPPINVPTPSPTKLATAEQMVSPTSGPPPTMAIVPVPVPASSNLNLPPPILRSVLSGKYNLEGISITIDYVQEFQNGQVVDVPRLRFDIPSLSDAPGPYLYLSKRPYSETEGGDLEDQDILISIDSGSDGQFNVKGRFDQFLDEIDNAQDLEDYANGSWIVWCGPFGVYLGGGAISSV